VKRSPGKPEWEQTGHSPNNRCSGPVLLSFWLHVAKRRGNQNASSLPGVGPCRPLSYPLGAGVSVGSQTIGVVALNEHRQALACDRSVRT
jgi:hypothetical protein